MSNVKKGCSGAARNCSQIQSSLVDAGFVVIIAGLDQTTAHIWLKKNRYIILNMCHWIFVEELEHYWT
jgi:hypothetical protein